MYTVVVAGLTGAAGVPAALAQSVPLPPVRELAPVERSSGPYGNVFGVREVAGRQVLVNDGVRRQLTLLDSAFRSRTVLLDSVAEGGQSYPHRAAPLIAYRGDSTMMADEGARALLLLDGTGKLARVMAPPKLSDLSFLANIAGASDLSGNLIYRPFYPFVRPALNEPAAAMPDSAPIVRANFETRVVDTIAALRFQPPSPVTYSTDANGKRVGRIVSRPLVMIDEWAVLKDGTLAVVRGHDYHVDFYRPNGERYSAPKLPFDFKHLTDDDKQKIIDSARTAEQNRRVAMTDDNESRVVGGGRGNGGGGGPVRVAPNPPLIDMPPISALPDYYPPIRRGAVMADVDGNIWILPTTSAQSKSGELIYDVVTDRGVLKERVRLPRGRSIAGFGRDGVVYLMTRVQDHWMVERTRVLRP